MASITLDHDDLAEAFEYLDGLRECGATNMFGAGAYLQEDYGMDRRVAGAVLSAWMKSFDPDLSADVRASLALEQAA